MAIKIKSTQDFGVDSIKMVVYGPSGIGKTTLALTAPNPIIISAEKGLLSLSDYDLPYIEVLKPADIDDAYNLLKKDKEFQTIFIDTVSEIGEVLLTDFLLTGAADGGPVKDGRHAYRMMAEAMMPMIRKFRDLPGKHVVFSAKLEIKEDEDNGIMLYRPMIPGQVIKNQLPFMFDAILLYDMIRDPKTKKDTRVMQTGNSRGKIAKDRSGKLDFYEKPDLTHIFDKIKG